MALVTLMPPPPGSYTCNAQFNYFSGNKTGTDVLLSMTGLNVTVIMDGILNFNYSKFIL
jgi:hypothetical protein